ncbi:MAG: putative phage abortive infection protein [Sphingobacteriaceae bacterium]|nr:putative phage abortive infection protein [Sphingobacteriaceae bacterium]
MAKVKKTEIIYAFYKRNKKVVINFIVGFITLFLIACTIVPIYLKFKLNPDYQHYTLEQYGNYGCYLSGILGFILVFLGYKTITAQRDLNEQQKIESTFMTMLDIVRKNSDNIHSKGKAGRYIFILINKEFNGLIKEFYDILLNVCNEDSKKVINIIWVILFYGLSDEIWPFLEEKINSIDKEILKNEHFRVKIDDLRKNHRTIFENNDKYRNKDKSASPKFLQWLKFDGYQNQLGHYYQHLYQTVTFIDTRKVLTYDQKKEYIKTVRAQLSVYELILFYYNTLSDLGKAWEDNEKDLNLQLVTKYRLLKNIPLRYMAGDIEMSPEIFYPKTLFTGQEDVGYPGSAKKIAGRKKLEKGYY